MKVLDHISGSNVTVLKNSEHYIDARRDVRTPGVSYIEIVRNGRVYHREEISDTDAPKRVVELMKEHFV